MLLVVPGNKPYSPHVAMDAATGLVLEYAADGTPYRATVLELAVKRAAAVRDVLVGWPNIERRAAEAARQDHPRRGAPLQGDAFEILAGQAYVDGRRIWFVLRDAMNVVPA